MALEFHPLANIFPMMTDAEANDLGDDMLEHGQREPIWLYDGMILDGRNRYNGCLLKDIEPRFVEFRGADALGFVISLNLKRRHLDESQRAVVAGKLATLRDGQRADQVEGVPIGRAASMLNVSERSVARAREVIDKGAPDLIAAVEQGEVSVSAAADFAKQPKEDQAAQIADFGSPAAAVKASKPRGTQGTGEFERYTPALHIAAARAVLGTIDLDPCTCEMAQATVKAEKYFTVDDDGLSKEWHGKVWMNPPYHRTLQTLFVDKLVAEIEAGRVKEAIVLTNNSTDTQWFKVAAESSTAICFTIGRVAFNTPEGVDVAPTQGQAFFYFGDNPAKFREVFSAIGFGMSVDWHYSADPTEKAAA